MSAKEQQNFENFEASYQNQRALQMTREKHIGMAQEIRDIIRGELGDYITAVARKYQRSVETIGSIRVLN